MSLPAKFAALVSAQTLYHRLAAPFELESGETLPEVVIAYRTWGNSENAFQHAILICHALTGSADVDAWWPGMIGSGKAFDPSHDFIICANILGSCYGTTGPVSRAPGQAADTGERYRANFPTITVRDMVGVQRELLDHLGVQVLELVTGPSLGGMQALEWALMYPERVRSVVAIGVGGKHSAWCIAISEAQRAAIRSDPEWRDGFYEDDAGPTAGLAAARMMAICTYRSWRSFEQRFGRAKSGDLFAVQSYLRHQGNKINQRFDANTYVLLTQVMHTHDLARGRGEYAEVLARLTQATLLVAVSSDALYPPHEQECLAGLLPNARYRVLASEHGHDGFLIETRALAALIADFRTSIRGGTSLRLLSSGSE